MPEAYGGEDTKYYSWGTGKTRAWVGASVSVKNDLIATVTVNGLVQSVSPYTIAQYGVKVNVGFYHIDGSGNYSVNGKGAVLNYGQWVPDPAASWTIEFPRKAQAYTATVFTWYYGETVGGYAACQNSGEVGLSVTIPALPVYTPRPVGNVASVRESDTRNTVSWENDQDATHPYSSIKIERMADSGQWSEIASLSGSATSYADTATSANHAYRYRVRPVNSAGAGDWAVSGWTYNTPAAPAKVTASRKTGTAVALAIDNPANTATAMELQRSSDAETWAAVKTIAGTVTEYEDSPGGGTWYYRARNVRGDLVSAWSPTSNAVVTIVAPAAPTLLEPASGVTISKAQEQIVFRWQHNPIDGSEQSAAQLQTSTDGGSTWATVQIDGSAQEHAVVNAYPVNSTVTWRVRTKGAHDDYGPYSPNRVFDVRQRPSVSFRLPASGAVIDNTPIAVALDYSDPSGALASAKLKVLRDGHEVYSMDMGSSAEAVIPASEWLPANGETYTLAAEVRSTSTLQASATRDVAVDFVPPMDGMLVVEPDIETGCCSITASVELDRDKAEVTSLSVYRVSNGVRKLLADNLRPGASIMDKYAPINADYTYEAVTFADSGAYATVPFPARIDSPWFFFYWDNEIAKAKWNPEGEKSLTRPRKKRVWYAGRKYPVSYDSDHVSDERNLSAVLMDAEEARAFERLVENGGRCVYKNGNGDVIRCDVEATLTPDWQVPAYYGAVSIGIVRIDGGDL